MEIPQGPVMHHGISTTWYGSSGKILEWEMTYYGSFLNTMSHTWQFQVEIEFSGEIDNPLGSSLKGHVLARIHFQLGSITQ